jgi:hypothetical protein
MTEQQPYDVVRRFDGFELRRYPAHVVAEVTLNAGFEDAGSRAFRYLFGYISGDNRSRSKVAMTAPVIQADARSVSEKIEMTSPVVQQSTAAGGYRVAFVLPATYTRDSAPEPTNPAVGVREVAASTAGVIRFSGRWSASRFHQHLDELRRGLLAAGFTPVGPPRFARFDPPFLPPFLRRNEVILDIAEPEDLSPES